MSIDPTAMTKHPETLWESEVLPEQIDGLGHMNIRFYTANARRGASRLMQDLGLGREEAMSDPPLLCYPDVYTRFRAEQLEGALLAVRGGVLDVEDEALRLYLEVVNRSTGDVAATFVQSVLALDAKTRDPVLFAPAVLGAARSRSLELPDYAKPRTLKLEPISQRLTREEGLRRNLRTSNGSVEIGEEWCDRDGFARLNDNEVMFMIAYGARPEKPRIAMRDNNFRASDGRLLGWAMMESRNVVTHVPRQGDRVEAFQATTQLLEKAHSTTRWIFLSSGELCAVMQTVALAFDIEARRPVAIPPLNREEMQASYHPDLD
jgi:acyl-CoA thioester hydrolase